MSRVIRLSGFGVHEATFFLLFAATKRICGSGSVILIRWPVSKPGPVAQLVRAHA